MTLEVKDTIEAACWVGKALFDLGKTAGSTGNISFRVGDKIYVTKSGSCFGRLTEDSWAILDLEGHNLNGKKPSKEYPIHLAFYKAYPEMQGVIHTHGPYATLISCLEGTIQELLPKYTPYLDMKLGKIGLIPYAAPGSEALFSAVAQQVTEAKGFLMANHGAVVGGKDIMDAFYNIEELEESAKLAWLLRQESKARRIVD